VHTTDTIFVVNAYDYPAGPLKVFALFLVFCDCCRLTYLVALFAIPTRPSVSVCMIDIPLGLAADVAKRRRAVGTGRRDRHFR